MDVPYLRGAHQRRQRIIEAVGSAALDGRPTTPERLFSWLGDIPIRAQANTGAEGYAAELFAVLSHSESTLPVAQEAHGLAQTAIVRAGRDLAGAAVLFRGTDAVTWRPEPPTPCFCGTLFGAGGTCSLSLSIWFRGGRAPSCCYFRSYMPTGLAKASRRSLANARTLRAVMRTVYGVLAKARSSSHVLAIAELLFAGHPLSFASASRIFRISRLAARKHLIRLERDGLAALATRRKSGLIYVARDGLMTFAQAGLTNVPKVSSRLAVTTVEPLSSDERARLDAITDEVSSRIDDLDRVIARLGFSDVMTIQRDVQIRANCDRNKPEGVKTISRAASQAIDISPTMRTIANRTARMLSLLPQSRQ